MRKVENALSKQGHDCKKPETVGQWILCHFLLLVGLGLALLFYVLNPNVFSSFGITSILSTAKTEPYFEVLCRAPPFLPLKLRD